MQIRNCLALAAFCGLATANIVPRATTTQAPTSTTSKKEVTAITGCHLHETALYCMAGSDEYQIKTTMTATTDIPAQFTDCHSHGSQFYCVDEDGNDVEASGESDSSEEEHDHDSEEKEEETSNEHCHFHAGVEHCTGGSNSEDTEEDSTSTDSSNEHCHFHAGVEHCTGGGESDESTESSSSSSCSTKSRDYNVPLRIGLLFVILATSALGVFGPILLQKFFPQKLNLLFMTVKQFGTGIILSTAFIHLYTHASMMFSNECVGELEYEGTTSAIVLAGIFISFLVEFIGHRVVQAKLRSESGLNAQERSKALLSSEVVSITVMEVGILFHSLLIGLTLVVAGDSFFLTLFVVILFHQVFEGLALGTRIATVGTREDAEWSAHHAHGTNASAPDASKSTQQSEISGDASSSDSEIAPVGLSLKRKLILASLFAFITPIGMAIGIGVLDQFNGNDKSTLIAIGTLDALSAGMLMWVGLVEMWAADWMTGAHGRKAELADANLLTVLMAGFGLVSGLVLMSVLGKWA